MIHVVTGHVCSGKSTFVRERARPGDVIIDLDVIAHALTTEATPDHDYPQHVAHVAMAARHAAMDEAIRRSRADGGFDLWIIQAYPEDRDWATYRRIGAATYEIKADPRTLRERAAAGRPARVRRILDQRLAAGVGSAAGPKMDGRPHEPSARISERLFRNGAAHGTPRPTS